MTWFICIVLSIAYLYDLKFWNLIHYKIIYFWQFRLIISGTIFSKILIVAALYLAMKTRYGLSHDDVIKWKHFPRYWPFVQGNSLVPGEFPTQRPVTRSFDVFFDLRLNKRLSKQSWGWWLEMLSCPLWRHRNVLCVQEHKIWIFFSLSGVWSRLFC